MLTCNTYILFDSIMIYEKIYIEKSYVNKLRDQIYRYVYENPEFIINKWASLSTAQYRNNEAKKKPIY